MIQVHFTWERRPSQPTADVLRRVVTRVLHTLDRDRDEVHVLVTGDPQIRSLNRHYRGQDHATDVLSFPDGDELPSGQLLLGEVVMSLDRAREQAAERGHSELVELQELLLHGVLHLLGYDHEVDNGEMDALELELRSEVTR